MCNITAKHCITALIKLYLVNSIFGYILNKLISTVVTIFKAQFFFYRKKYRTFVSAVLFQI